MFLSGNTVQPRQGRVKVARQELPGKPKDEGQSRQGRLKMGSYQPSLPGLCCSRVFTRQFLPGYFQPRLAALSSRMFRAQSLFPRNIFCISMHGD
jgi:hypothetical protein